MGVGQIKAAKYLAWIALIAYIALGAYLLIKYKFNNYIALPPKINDDRFMYWLAAGTGIIGFLQLFMSMFMSV